MDNSWRSVRRIAAMDEMGSPGLPDSAVPSDTDFGGPASSFGFMQRESLEEDNEVDHSERRNSIQQQQEQQQASSKSRQADLLSGLNFNDQHSSEEELEVINSPKVVPSQGCRPATAPEKRKWSQVSNSGPQTQQQLQGQQQPQQRTLAGDLDSIGATCSAPVSRAGRELAGSGSSDEEVQGLLGGRSGSGSVISQPVQFRTSPPVDAHKPGRSLSPPPKLFHASTREPRSLPRPRSRPRPQSHTHLHCSHLDCHHHHHHHHHHYHHHHHHHHRLDSDLDLLNACSPRKRHRPPHRLPRPCLDFEKMQQLKARAVTTWRHSGEHGNELSVFCW
ncbi:la-related protein Larp4B-like isoform X2 [Prorops nasuta]|uniref:la-related protein Larp4B-like isoform X2 n=1 Tax=Prorops nasuta TaxID=863751 RepID=UPI0034CD8031